jgi:adenylate kinase family enzyme
MFAHNSESGERARISIDRGQLVPNSLISQIIAVEVVNYADNNWLLDGV